MVTISYYTNFNMADLEHYREKLIGLILDITSTYSYAKPLRVKVNGLFVFDEKICEIQLKGKDFIKDAEKMKVVLYRQTMQEIIDIAYKIIDLYNTGAYDKYFAKIDHILKTLAKNKEINKGIYFNNTVEKILVIVKKVENTIAIGNLQKDVAIIKDNVQNTTDVVNLFTDIDKNRTNLEDKVDKLEHKINNIEANISQILIMLQKS